MGVKQTVVAGLAVQLAPVLVHGGRVERLAAVLTLDALLVEGSPVHGHHGLRRVDGGLAGGAQGGPGGSCPTHPN